MPEKVRFTLIVLAVCFFGAAGRFRVQSLRSGEKLDRAKEGWPLFFAIRLTGLLSIGTTAAWLYNPNWFQPVTVLLPVAVHWAGVVLFAGAAY